IEMIGDFIWQGLTFFPYGAPYRRRTPPYAFDFPQVVNNLNCRMKTGAVTAAIMCLAAAAAATAAADAPGRKVVAARRAATPPVLDGRLDDAVWREAAFVEDLHIVVSNEFGTPGERSRVYVAFDDDNLYFAARFFDSQPDRIVAKVLSRRDYSFGEDSFSIILDPFDQGRAGYMFDVNSNGMRSEAIYIDEERQNWDWEGLWDAAGRIDDEGWAAEAAIPIKTLSFDPARDAWGVNFTRWKGADSEQFGWVSYNRKQDLVRTGLVTGLAGLQQGRGLDVVPGLRAGSTRDHVTDETDDFLEPSLDVFWKVTPSMTAALTLNPDFSGTTVDTRQVNLTRFDLFFPEQRAFFLQDSDIFQFGRLEEESGLPFFSRRIGLDDEGETLTLDAGLKLTGRAGPVSVGVLGVRQDAAVGPDSAELFVGRVAVNVLEESSLGVIVTSGNPDTAVDNSLVGVDFRYLNTRFGGGRSLEATAWYQQTDTEGVSGDDAGYGIGFGVPNSEGWNGKAALKVLGRNFFPALGFASRTDIEATSAELGYTWRPDGHWIRSIKTEVEAEFIEPIDGDDRSRQVNLKFFGAANQSSDHLVLMHLFQEEEFVEPFEISDGIVIPGGDYRFDYTCITLKTGEQRVLSTESSVCGGGFYDGDIFLFETRTTWRPSKHLKVVLGGAYNDVDLPQGDFITRLATLNLDVAFSTAWSWENFIQYDNVTDTVGLNSILRWVPRAGQEGVLAFNTLREDFDRDGSFRPLVSDLTVKLSYTFRY
ncbi:MAG: carbohydrate binding family 9 domain-containing protein, partial [Gammaproteobacteria bacterium]|nr:carbohydrate binding family 9 domain-containing protein [Gammaproteobacteria bacterium]